MNALLVLALLIALAQVAQIVLLVRLAKRPSPPLPGGEAAANDAALARLAEHLERPFSALYGELQAEHRRLHQLLGQAEQLVAQLDRADPLSTAPSARPAEPSAAPAPVAPEPAAPAADDPAPAVGAAPAPGAIAARLARDEARRLLLDGVSAAEVAVATGLPEGEVKILANLLGGKGGAVAAGH